jgi:IS5 family transposase
MLRPKDERQKNLFGPALEAIIDMRHPLVLLAGAMDWAFLERSLWDVYRLGPGQPLLPVRLMAGLMILEHMHGLSDKALCARSSSAFFNCLKSPSSPSKSSGFSYPANNSSKSSGLSVVIASPPAQNIGSPRRSLTQDI